MGLRYNLILCELCTNYNIFIVKHTAFKKSDSISTESMTILR